MTDGPGRDLRRPLSDHRGSRRWESVYWYLIFGNFFVVVLLWDFRSLPLRRRLRRPPVVNPPCRPQPKGPEYRKCRTPVQGRTQYPDGLESAFRSQSDRTISSFVSDSVSVVDLFTPSFKTLLLSVVLSRGLPRLFETGTEPDWGLVCVCPVWRSSTLGRSRSSSLVSEDGDGWWVLTSTKCQRKSVQLTNVYVSFCFYEKPLFIVFRSQREYDSKCCGSYSRF